MINNILIVFFVLLINADIGESVNFEHGQPCGINKKCVKWFLCYNTTIVTDGSFLIDDYRRRKRETWDDDDEEFNGPTADTTLRPMRVCPSMHTCCEIKIITPKEHLLNSECASTAPLSGLIHGGSKVLPGKFPFLAALVQASDGEFFCGGSLITDKHVLTAAHCVHEKGSKEKLHPDDVLVLLGRHNLALRAERNSETRNAEKILIHEDWKFHTTKYDADLAILVMDRSVSFSRSIRPICITNNQAALSLSNGTVAGWGQGDSGVGHENLPKMATARTISGDKCFELQSDLGPMYSSRMFCAKGDNASPCHGDSGGSFFVNSDGRWTATGIVSVGDCNPNKYMLYTKISDFIAWIETKISENP